MGKTVGRWLRDLFHGGRKKTKKKKEQQQSPILAADESVFSKEKRKWGFAKSKREEAGAGPVVERGCRGGDRSYEAEQNKRAMVVAAATAAVAEAAVAAAQAAAAVVRLTSIGRAVGFYGSKAELLAATKIQTAFRGYLARRALRALRALVKLQALVRGHIVRKQAAETLRCMQALVRVQARARACRSLSSELSLRRRTLNPNLGRRLDPWGEDQDRILEVDTGKPRPNPKRRPELSSSSMASDQNSRSFATSVQFSVQSPSSVDMPLQQSLSPLRAAAIVAGEKLGRGTSLAAALSDCSSSFFSTYSDHPSYMACTESSKAKARSQSAPKQRPEVEKSGGGHRGTGAAAGRTTAPSSSSSASSMQVKFSSKAYPGSGRLDRLGMPIRY